LAVLDTGTGFQDFALPEISHAGFLKETEHPDQQLTGGSAPSLVWRDKPG